MKSFLNLLKHKSFTKHLQNKWLQKIIFFNFKMKFNFLKSYPWGFFVAWLLNYDKWLFRRGTVSYCGASNGSPSKYVWRQTNQNQLAYLPTCWLARFLGWIPGKSEKSGNELASFFEKIQMRLGTSVNENSSS